MASIKRTSMTRRAAGKMRRTYRVAMRPPVSAVSQRISPKRRSSAGAAGTPGSGSSTKGWRARSCQASRIEPPDEGRTSTAASMRPAFT